MALGWLLNGSVRVLCLSTPVEHAVANAVAAQGVEIVQLPRIAIDDPATTASTAEVLLRSIGINRLDLTIGHDVVTGPIAVSLVSRLGGKTAVIHHMSYGSYQSLKTSGTVAKEKEDSQLDALTNADHVIAVGPLLKQSAEQLCQRDVCMIVPGMAKIEPITLREGVFRAIAFGRLGQNDDRIKQGSLAAASFGRFVAKAASLSLELKPRFNLVGLSTEDYESEETRLRKIVQHEAGRQVNVVAVPYTEDREKLFSSLAQNEVAMMLSWHEGFGLVGWEAIAAGVPLIVTKASGLYSLLRDSEETLGGDCVSAVDVKGGDSDSANEDDIEQVSNALMTIATNLPSVLRRAKKLRNHLRSIHTWDACARQLLKACNWESELPPRNARETPNPNAPDNSPQLSSVSEPAELLRTVDWQTAVLVQRANIPATIVEQGPPQTDPPVLPSRLAFRNETVRDIAAHFTSTAWIALHGGEDVGKTTLGCLLASHLGELRGWIRLAGTAHGQFINTLEQNLKSLTSEPISVDRGTWDARLCALLGTGSLLVVDQIPDLAVETTFAERLHTLVQACRLHGVRLLTLGVSPVPQGLQHALGAEGVVSLPVPLFNISETLELSRSSCAPEEMLGQTRVQLLHILTEGHPVLIVSALRYLEDRNWIWNQDVLKELLGGAHAQTVGDEVLRRLLATSSEVARDLLYRLSIARHPFRLADVEAVAVVAPPIARAKEVFAELVGPWIRSCGSGQYAISPLIRPFGEAAISPQLRRPIHAAFGESLVARTTVTLPEVGWAIFHLLAGEEFDKAGSLFAMGLYSIKTAGASPTAMVLLSFWDSERMPSSIAAPIRLLTRAKQLHLRSEAGLETSVVLADVLATFDEVDPSDNDAIVGGCVFTGFAVAKSNPTMAQEMFVRAIQRWPSMQGQKDGSSFDMPSVSPARLLWLTAIHLTTDEEFKSWVESLERLSKSERDAVFAGGEGLHGAAVFSSRIVVREYQKPPNQRNWPASMELLDWIEVAARRLDQERLLAGVIRARLQVLGEFLRDPQRILDAVRHAETFGDPGSMYIVYSEAARQLVIVEDYDNGREWSRKALSIEPLGVRFDAVYLRSAAGVAFGEIDLVAGEQYVKDALEIARTGLVCPLVDVAAVACQYAVAVYLNRGIANACDAWCSAIELVLKAEDDSVDWRSVFTSFAHATAYVSFVAMTGSPPQYAGVGTPWFSPYTKMFFVRNAALANRYDPKRRSHLLYLFGELARHLGNDGLADRLFLDAKVLAHESNDLRMQARCVDKGRTTLVLKHFWDEALATLRDAFRTQASFKVSADAGMQHSGDGGGQAPIALDALRSIEESVALAIVVPSVMVILLGDNTPRSLTKLSLSCGRMTQDSPIPGLWQELQTVIEGCASESARTEIGSNANNSTYKCVRVAGRLLKSSTAVVGDALIEHLSIFPDLTGIFGFRSAEVRRILVPFLEQFWSARIAEQGFLLHNPSLVRYAFSRALARPVEQRVPAILAAVLEGVRIRGIPDEVKEWLQSV